MAKLLLDHDSVHPDSWDYNRRIHLPFPALGVREGVRGLLLEQSPVNPNSPVPRDRLPVSPVASLGYRGVIPSYMRHEVANINSSDNHRQTPLPYATRFGQWGGVGLLSEARSFNCRWSENHVPMPTSIATEIASCQEVRHPPLAADNVTLCPEEDPPLSNPERSAWAMARKMGRQSREFWRRLKKQAPHRPVHWTEPDPNTPRATQENETFEREAMDPNFFQDVAHSKSRMLERQYSRFTSWFSKL